MIGSFYRNSRRSDSGEGVKYYLRKRDVWRQAGNFLEEGNTLIEIASMQSDSLIDSLDAARRAFDHIDPETKDASGKPIRPQLSGTLVRIAQMYLTEDKEKAIATYEEALQIQMLARESMSLVSSTFLSEARILLEMKTSEGATKARQLFQKVIEIDPAYAPAWAGLADVNVRLADDASQIDTRDKVEAARRVRAGRCQSCGATCRTRTAAARTR